MTETYRMFPNLVSWPPAARFLNLSVLNDILGDKSRLTAKFFRGGKLEREKETQADRDGNKNRED